MGFEVLHAKHNFPIDTPMDEVKKNIQECIARGLMECGFIRIEKVNVDSISDGETYIASIIVKRWDDIAGKKIIVDVNKHHPKWKRLDDTISCPECGEIFTGLMVIPDFCPNCKSKLMEVEE